MSQNLKNRTPEQREKDIKFLMSLSMPELRRRQDLLAIQQKIAYEKYIIALHTKPSELKKWEEVGEDLDQMYWDYFYAIDRKNFGKKRTIKKSKRTTKPPIPYIPIYKEYDNRNQIVRIRPDGRVTPVRRREVMPPDYKYFNGERYELINDYFEAGDMGSLLSRQQAERFAKQWRESYPGSKARIVKYQDGYCVYGV
jgi:hypothetical protein